MHVNPARMTKNTWGSVFWSFSYTASILVQYTYANDRTNSFLNFPALLYNIDRVLPCPMCIENYKNIKHQPRILHIIRSASFGLLVTAVYQFHSLINSHATANSTYELRGVDFALLYNCFPRSDTDSDMHVELYHVSNLLLKFYGTTKKF